MVMVTKLQSTVLILKKWQKPTQTEQLILDCLKKCILDKLFKMCNWNLICHTLLTCVNIRLEKEHIIQKYILVEFQQ